QIISLGGNDYFGGVAIQGDGRIVVAGWGTTAQADYLLRYNGNGSLDTGFGTGGVVTLVNPSGWLLTSGTMVAGVAVQSDGQIVLGGQLYDPVGQAAHFIAVRVSATGALDTGYGEALWASTQFENVDSDYAMALQPDGRLLLAGSARP